MTSYDDTKVQLTINRMTQECYENVPDKSSTELYLISQDPTSIAKIDLDAQGAIESEISSIQSDLNALQSDLNGLSTEVSTLSEWTTAQIDDLIGDVQEVSSQTTQNAQDIADMSASIDDISANLTHSTVRRWEYVEYNGLTFTAEQANSTVAMEKVGSAPDVSLEYSTGDGWHDFIVGETTVTLPNIGDQMVVRAKTPNAHTATSRNDRNTFSMTGQIEASGNLAAVLNKDVEQGKVLDSTLTYHLCGLFQDCTGLVGSAKGLIIPFETLYIDSLNSLFLNTRITIAPDLPCTSSEGSTYCFTFQNCTDLVQAPALPLTTLGTYAYTHMFDGCTSLTHAPELPATTLTTGCYDSMFVGCTSLTTAPELPATTLADHCYQNMFVGCTSLTTAPELLATNLAQECYRDMFNGCSALVNPPSELPALSVPLAAYGDMFSGTAITKSPYIRAASVDGEWGMASMFKNCSSLNEIKIAYTGNFSGTGVPSNAFTNWVQGVASSGTFYYDGEDTTTGNSAIPTGWEVRESTWPGLTFTAEQANSTLYLHKDARAPVATFEYTTDGMTWQDFIPDSTNVTLANVGDKVAIRAKSSNAGLADINANIHKFVMTGKIAASNSIMYLLKNDGDLDTISSVYCFCRMFLGCTSLTTPPELPALTLASNCYNEMFRDCTSLTTAPELPATTLANYCYQAMFQDCTSLTTAPELPATSLRNDCYNQMFSGCSSLTTAPSLNATSLANTCYFAMFFGCTSLTQAPALPATTLASFCYSYMFRNCTSLNEIKIGYTGNFSGTGVPSNAFTNWVNGVASTGTFYYNGSDTTRGVSAIPNNWTVQSF